MYNKPVCRGSWVLGTACGRCERCEDARPGKPLPVAPNPQEGGTHTPGPWSFDYGTVPPDGPGTYADIYVDGGDTIIAHFNNQIVEGLANARLIAAAPALLEALDLAVAILQEAEPRLGYADGSLGQIEIEEAIETGLAALLQATGGENGR